MHICIPYSMIEPIRDLLCSTVQGETLETDKRWVRLLSKQVQSAEVELVANFTQVKITLDQILNMEVGDVLPIDVPQTITAAVDGMPVMECRCGIANGQYALRVERMVATSERE